MLVKSSSDSRLVPRTSTELNELMDKTVVMSGVDSSKKRKHKLPASIC